METKKITICINHLFCGFCSVRSPFSLGALDSLCHLIVAFALNMQILIYTKYFIGEIFIIE